jgi:FSR family fosmidomycin resistance protein-like MFS transporter
MPLLVSRILFAIMFGHFTVDVLNGQRTVLIAYLSGPMGLSNASIGLFATVYAVIGALAQPIFGYLADRVGSRWIVTLGVAWISIFYALSVGVSGDLSLVFMILASVGSGAFHPAGASQATQIGQKYMSGKEATSTSLFFLFGQAGYFFGPILGGKFLDLFGLSGTYLIATLGIPATLLLAWAVRDQPKPLPQKIDPNTPSQTPPQPSSAVPISIIAVIILGGVAFMQSWAQSNMTTFLPKYLRDLGESATIYGLSTALFMGGSAIGNFVGGIIADRIGKKIVVIGSLILSSIPLLFIGILGYSSWFYILTPLAGALTGATLSIIIIYSQYMIPKAKALASGLAMGFTFSSGAIGTYFSGAWADAIGFPLVFEITAGIALVAGILAIGLQDKKPEPV